MFCHRYWRKKPKVCMSTRPSVAATFGEPVNVGPPINTPAEEGNPEISADGQTLYFSRDRPGGQGGTDLWYSRRVRNKR